VSSVRQNNDSHLRKTIRAYAVSKWVQTQKRNMKKLYSKPVFPKLNIHKTFWLILIECNLFFFVFPFFAFQFLPRSSIITCAHNIRTDIKPNEFCRQITYQLGELAVAGHTQTSSCSLNVCLEVLWWQRDVHISETCQIQH
jgi:hypothetical protein